MGGGAGSDTVKFDIVPEVTAVEGKGGSLSSDSRDSRELFSN